MSSGQSKDRMQSGWVAICAQGPALKWRVVQKKRTVRVHMHHARPVVLGAWGCGGWRSLRHLAGWADRDQLSLLHGLSRVVAVLFSPRYVAAVPSLGVL